MLEKVDQGYQVQKHETKGSILIQWRSYNDEPWDYKNFEFQTLKKGDLYWCQDIGKERKLCTFVGKYNEKVSPLFSQYENLIVPTIYDIYEKIGLNIFDKQELHND